MSVVHQWAIAWGVPLVAINDLLHRMGVGFDSPQSTFEPGMSETAVQSRVRLEGAKQGVILWRNNVGALPDARGVPVRYGLCNDTAQLNKKIKSGDLIGAKKIVITREMIGSTIGQFVSRECKPAGWVYTGTEHEVAQLKWIEIVTSLGGDAAFVTGEGSFK